MEAVAAVVHGPLAVAVVDKVVAALAVMTEICGLVQTAVQAVRAQAVVAAVHFTMVMHLLVAELLNQVVLAVEVL
jgi:hypothetical protein